MTRPDGGDGTVHEVIAEIGRQVTALAPDRPAAFYRDVTELSSSVDRLRGLAKSAMADEWRFAEETEPYRHELRVHCYRMVGSYDDAEDLVQEVMLRAWRRRDTYEGRASLRAWLYRIATNASLDFLRANPREATTYEPVPGLDSGGDVPPARVTWLQPYPDEQIPDDRAISRETIELVFLTAIQHLPARQRAALILRDVLEFSAAETAELLDLSVASVNSALQRARPTMRQHLPRERSDWTRTEPTDAEREVLRRYVEAVERLDFDAMAALLHEDVTLTMPPAPFWFTTRDALLEFVRVSLDPASPAFLGHWKCRPTTANRMPAAAGYVRRPGTAVYRAQVLDVVRIEDGRIAQVTSFEPHLFPAFGLPLTIR
jgi:RNA polymerase sigma-70 factor (TIGR02960 family)